VEETAISKGRLAVVEKSLKSEEETAITRGRLAEERPSRNKPAEETAIARGRLAVGRPARKISRKAIHAREPARPDPRERTRSTIFHRSVDSNDLATIDPSKNTFLSLLSIDFIENLIPSATFSSIPSKPSFFHYFLSTSSNAHPLFSTSSNTRPLFSASTNAQSFLRQR
jgi:hypothetical protein